MPTINIERHKLREDFLDSFVRNLILNSFNPNSVVPEMKSAEIKFEIPTAPSPVSPILPSLAHKELRKRAINIRPAPRQNYQKIRKMPSAPIALPPLSQLQPAKKGQKPETINLGKIAPMLTDPSVFSVESPGPGKNVLVNRGGTIQTSALSLSQEDIQDIMQNFSDKTRIPLIPGVFKAAYQDLVVTAVVSDFVGTRFIIQKRTPFQRY
jgi:hypothetical protein